MDSIANLNNLINRRALRFLRTLVVMFVTLYTTLLSGAAVLKVNDQELADGTTQTTVPLLLDGFSGFSAVQFTVQWDPSVLAYNALGSFNANLLLLNAENGDGYVYINTAQTAEGKLMVAYDNPLTSDLTVADGSTLFEIIFDVAGGAGSSSAVSFIYR